MVLPHVLRTLRYVALGYSQKPVGPLDECVTRVFVGVRKMDGFMHVNNAKYLEIMEFARYNQGSRAGWNKKFIDARIWPVIGVAHVHYMTAIMPWRFVNIHTRFAGYSNNYMTLHQDIRSTSGKLHATAVFRVAMLHNNKALDLAEALDKLGFPKEADGSMNKTIVQAAKEHHEKFPHIKPLIDADDGWRDAIRAQVKAERESKKKSKKQ